MRRNSRSAPRSSSKQAQLPQLDHHSDKQPWVCGANQRWAEPGRGVLDARRHLWRAFVVTVVVRLAGRGWRGALRHGLMVELQYVICATETNDKPPRKGGHHEHGVQLR